MSNLRGFTAVISLAFIAVLPACRYEARCERRQDVCAGALPWRESTPSHHTACWNPA